MNPITCGMAADLLPLYLDGCCSADSRAALEAHMDACPACRAQYAQLRRDLTPAAPAAEDPGTDGIARALARKMRRRKRCLRALCAVLGVLLAIIIKTFATGACSEDMLGSFICAGIGGAFMAQIFVNVGMNLRLLPVIGVTLPFYSAGGSSVLMLYICVGLVLSVYMHNTKKLFG